MLRGFWIPWKHVYVVFLRWRQLVVPFENKNKKIKQKDVFSAIALAMCTSASGPASWHHASLDATQQIKTTTTKIISSGNTTGRQWGRGPRVSSSEVSRQSLVVWWSLHCRNSALECHRHGVSIYLHKYIYNLTKGDRDPTIVLLPPTGRAHGFPLRLAVDEEFLLRFSQDGSRQRGLGGRAAACVRRTMRGERHTLMVESSLADSSSSWSAGLKATEFTTSSCARRARQML